MKKEKDMLQKLNEMMMEINRYCKIESDRSRETESGQCIRNTRYLDPRTGIGYTVEMFNGQTVKIEVLI